MGMQLLPHFVQRRTSTERAHEEPMAVCLGSFLISVANFAISVYNLKRRIASLPPISLAVFVDQIQTLSEPAGTTEDEHVSGRAEEEEEDISPYQCLFCQRKFDDNIKEFEATLEHMATAHGLFIPDRESITDIESFLGYLATEVRSWHECLYCGTTRDSTLAIQSHMRDSSHCKLNLDREPELLEFWEVASDEDGVFLGPAMSGMDRRKGNTLSTVQTKTSRLSHQRRAKAARARGTRLALQGGPAESPIPRPRDPQQQSCRQLSRQDEMGIQNVGVQQRHALVLAVKRSQKVEQNATRASEWSYARKANRQKHDQDHGPLSWAKGGAHNLLPR